MPSVYPLLSDLALKTCTHCRQAQQLEAFSCRARSKDGRGSWCKRCKNEAKARWDDEHQQHRRDYSARYYQEHAEHIGEAARAWHAHKRKVDPAYREASKKRSAAWRLSHPDANRNYVQEHAEHLRACARAHYAIAPEKGREWARRREARKRQQCYGTVDYAAILARDGFWCHICQSPVRPDEVEYDHVIPLSKGGLHSMNNVKVSHRSCNRRKKDRLLIDTKEERRDGYVEEVPRTNALDQPLPDPAPAGHTLRR